MMRYFNGFCGFGRGFMGGGLGMIILLIVIAIVIFVIFRYRGNNAGFRNEYVNSIEILNERFARGEINEEEYKQKKALLLKH